ncbi:CRAL/TRIO domain-containing protein [Terfezia boudieri ATCC MYA-4762]|uniref:CRAL/TRIO domain-containing protein n=1 Tax=Terfezia boudieri ATCC MYA-4762 TaxID=1051890 RepID=A0A3N4LXB7_9PEZI|nr:CRAL/TRIO domain-containing protein [Terfezia boudieri ATCC MYA-4762]
MSNKTPVTTFEGQLGHLTPDQEKAFAEFKQLCAEKGIYTPAEAGKPASHDDIFMIRFLRARRFVTADALILFSDSEEWRKAEKIDDVYDHFDVGEYEQCRKLHPQWTGRRDRDGMPLFVYTISHVSGTNLTEYTAAKNKLQRLAMLYETVTQFVIPVANAVHVRARNHAAPAPKPTTETAPTADPEKKLESVSSITIITDIGNVGLWTFWNLKGHMQESAKIASDRYPETLHRQYIVNAPSFFPTVWGWIKKWFDPVTTSKITILSGSLTLKELREQLEVCIAPENLPKKYGGDLDWDYGDVPDVDEEIREVVGEDVFADGGLTGPVRWVVGGKGMVGRAVKVGSIGGKDRRGDKPDA